jgi:hypothetical protein
LTNCRREIQDPAAYSDGKDSYAMNAMDADQRYVLKPAFGTASELVCGPVSLQGVSKAYEAVVRARTGEQAFFGEDGVNWASVCLVERWVHGDEFTVEGVVDFAGRVDIAGVCQKEFAFTWRAELLTRARTTRRQSLKKIESIGCLIWPKKLLGSQS